MWTVVRGEGVDMRRMDRETGGSAAESAVLTVLIALLAVALAVIAVTVGDQIQALVSTITQALNPGPILG
jgi:Flp pilus assembly pilin Flp